MVLFLVYLVYLPSSIFLLSLPILTTFLIPFILVLVSSYNLTSGSYGSSYSSDSYGSYSSTSITTTNTLTITNIEKILDSNSIPDLQDIPLEIVNQCQVMP
jgi:hypothetical protein